MTIISTYNILLQLKLDGFEKAAEQNTTFGVLVSLIIILFAVVTILFKKYDQKNNEIKFIQDENLNNINKIRNDYIKREDETTRTWRESEKETLTVLKGVNSVLELSEKMKENDTKNIIDKISILERSIERVGSIEQTIILLENSIDNAIIELHKKNSNKG